MANDHNGNPTAKLAWIEPDVQSLDIGDTENSPNRGRDGSIHVDCTRS